MTLKLITTTTGNAIAADKNDKDNDDNDDFITSKNIENMKFIYSSHNREKMEKKG